MCPNPLIKEETHGMDGNTIPVEGGRIEARWPAATAAISVATG